MKQLLSVWLVPQEEDEKYLKEIIDNLALENNSPKFIPHLTVFGDIRIDPIDLEKAIEKVFANVKKFSIKKTNISQSEAFFKTVFVEFEKSELLINIFRNLSKETIEKNEDEFMPHISLIYKTMSEQEKNKIIESLKIKDKFIIDRVFINAPKEGTEDFFDVEGWRTLFTKQLASL